MNDEELKAFKIQVAILIILLFISIVSPDNGISFVAFIVAVFLMAYIFLTLI